MAQLQGSGTGNQANTAIVNTQGQLFVSPSYANIEIIRQASGSPAVNYVFSNIPESILVDNLGSNAIYFAFNSTANPAAGSTMFLASGVAMGFDLRIGSISIQGSGTTTPMVQVVGVR